MSYGLFEAAVTSQDEKQIVKQAAQDKLSAAIYDVKEKFGSYLFQADSPQGFDDRAKLSYVDICNTIEPHVHARTGVYARVIKALKRDWRQASQSLDTSAEVTDQALSNSQAGKGSPKTPAPPKVHTPGQPLLARIACYPGCHEDEAHAKKFHKDEEKEASRHQAGPPVQQDPDRAHQVLDHTHELVDQRTVRPGLGEQAMGEHQQGYRDPQGGLPQHAWPFEAPQQGSPQHSTGFDPEEYMGLQGFPHEGSDRHANEDPHGGSLPGPNYPPAPPLPEHLDNYYRDQRQRGDIPAQPLHIQTNRRHADDGAYAEHAPDHPELDTNVTFQDHQGDNLKPCGDFDGYKDRVDQGADSKVDHNFTAPNGGEVREHNDSGDHNFVTSSYQAIARMIQADMAPTNVSGATNLPPAGTPGAGAGGAATPATSMTADPSAGSGAPVTTPTPGIMSSYHQISAMLRQAAPGAPTPTPGPVPMTPNQQGANQGFGPPATMNNPPAPPGSFNMEAPGGGAPAPGPTGLNPNMASRKQGSRWAHQMIQEVGTKEARKRLISVARSHGLIDDKSFARISNLLIKKVADSNYLQKADEALTRVLNEKAEEFQNTIAPLQQALITIQQAEQLANPLNVSPPAGTVNVMPGQDQGGAPQGQVGADPAAAGLAAQPADPTQQPQQVQARKRGGKGKG